MLKKSKVSVRQLDLITIVIIVNDANQNKSKQSSQLPGKCQKSTIFFSFSRQLNTINSQSSSLKYTEIFTKKTHNTLHNLL